MHVMRIIPFVLLFLVISLTPVLALEYNLVYDGNGNLLSGDGFNRSYNGFNQLSTVSYENGTLLYNYTFHPIEERVLVKKEYDLDGSLKEKIIYVNEMFVIVENSSGVYNFTYVKANGQLLAEKVNGETKFILNDHLGSNSIVTNSSGEVIENTTYTPFGSVVNGGSAVRYGYEGKEHDGITNDIDFHFRQYKPSWGLFLQPDSLLPNVYDPQQLNRYAFERNNPYKYTDEDGHNPFLVGAVLGFAYGTVSYGLNHMGEGRGGFKEFATYMGKGIGHGLIGAAAGAAIAGIAFTPGGRVAAQGGISYYSKLAAVGASESVLHQTFEGQLDPSLVGMSALSSSVPFPGTQLRGGTFYSTSHLTKNSMIFGQQLLYSQLVSSFFSSIYGTSSQADEAKSNSGRRSSSGGYTPSDSGRDGDPSNGECGVNMSCA